MRHYSESRDKCNRVIISFGVTLGSIVLAATALGLALTLGGVFILGVIVFCILWAIIHTMLDMWMDEKPSSTTGPR